MALLVTGAAARIVVILTTNGLPYDIHSLEVVWAALRHDTFHVYSQVNPHGNFHWPYAPGYLPVVAAFGWFADHAGANFSELIRIVPMLADLALAGVIYVGLGGRVKDSTRLVAATLVTLGPVFVAVSGYSAQIDSTAILPAAIALLVWEQGSPRRALAAGVLIGIAGAVKSVPLLMLLALAPSARSPRELLTLVGAAIAVPVILCVPFVIADPSGILGIRHYAGAPGAGGLSLVLQPSLAQLWLTKIVAANGLEQWLFIDHAWVANLFAVCAYGGFAIRSRPEPRRAAAVLWLLVLAFGSGFFFQYLVWLLPFLLLAGYVRSVALLQALITVPMLIFYVSDWHTQTTLYIYVALMLLAWVAWVAGGVLIARRGSAGAIARRPAAA